MVQPPEYNPNARQFDQMFVEKRMTDMCPLSPPAENLVDSLTQVCRALHMSLNVHVWVQLELARTSYTPLLEYLQYLHNLPTYKLGRERAMTIICGH